MRNSASKVKTTADEILGFFLKSSLLEREGLLGAVGQLHFDNDQLHFKAVEVNSYLASVASDFIRHQLLADKISFTFETVMSYHDKITFLQQAQHNGFRTYLYYVATEDPEINISRVHYRVGMGGHSVPDNKITDRYYRSLGLLFDAVCYSNRAYIFDNSGNDHQKVLIAEVTDGQEIEMKTSNQ
jgi:predicted ABC-type ATPase